MALKDVTNYRVKSGTGGRVFGAVDGRQLHVGVCSIPTDPLGGTGDIYTDWRVKLGLGPLASGVMDHFGATGPKGEVRALGIAGSIPGVVSAIGFDQGDAATPGNATHAAVGTSLYRCEVTIKIVKDGRFNVAQYQVKSGLGKNWSQTRTVPVDGLVVCEDTGVSVQFTEGVPPEDSFVAGNLYTFEGSAPQATISNIIAALGPVLELYDFEAVVIHGDTDSVDWAALNQIGIDQENKKKPISIYCAFRAKLDSETWDQYCTAATTESTGFASDYLTITAGNAEVTDKSGRTHDRSVLGIMTGFVQKIQVNKSIGEVAENPINNISITGYDNSHASVLVAARLVALRYYPHTNGMWFELGIAMGDPALSVMTRDEVRRTVFKAIRLSYAAALPSLKKLAVRAGKGTDGFAANLKSAMDQALDTMIKRLPIPELDDYLNDIPEGQDIVNNGVTVLQTLYGIPVVEEINIYHEYKYAQTI